MTADEIEKEMLEIRELWNSDALAAERGVYDMAEMPDAFVYSDKGAIKRIQSKGVPEGSFMFQYRDGMLVFAYYGLPENRLYFKNDWLFRRLGSDNANSSASTQNYAFWDEGYIDWQAKALKDAYDYYRKGLESLQAGPDAPAPSAAPRQPSVYEFVNGDATWREAYDAAISRGGYLFEANSAEEFNDLTSRAREIGIMVLWLGARRDPSQSWGDVKWAGTGDGMTYLKWYPGEPSYMENGEDEDCLMAFCVNGEWFFNDSKEDISEYYSGKIGFIVEKDGRSAQSMPAPAAAPPPR
jgi:hypothetical protein